MCMMFSCQQLFQLQPAEPKYKRLTPQSQRDSEKIQKRVVDLGPKVEYVSSYVDKFFGTHVNIEILTSIARIVEQKYNIPLDRLAKRNRRAMLCWYAENWDVVVNILDEKKSDARKIFKRRGRKNLAEIEALMEKTNLQKKMQFDPMDLSTLLNYHDQ